ncbi:hypothetical protein Anacy_1766 [Anabaena cylindrica PCC 7122]|uniref:Uncharacterized protein n=1 Tax=Anabaena cylindrica (strain ATCC 27899 / PCC 7122) TaxID=272123 RepID=K9ZEU7_ANACC|nr:hypothetical protein Anacy_1766 [Anabaena cylindrica PCC 7122]BAY05765.1 hypothetical protein NIES19_50410 [Anabaena cylindrica PCC 7122]
MRSQLITVNKAQKNGFCAIALITVKEAQDNGFCAIAYP